MSGLETVSHYPHNYLKDKHNMTGLYWIYTTAENVFCRPQILNLPPVKGIQKYLKTSFSRKTVENVLSIHQCRGTIKEKMIHTF